MEHFRKTWDGIRWENKIWRVMGVGQMIALVIMSYAVIHTDKIIVLSPPNLSEKVEIARDKASLAYKKGFAMYLATLGGNVTPGNGTIIKEAVGPLLSPAIYRQVMDNIEQQINALKHPVLANCFNKRHRRPAPDPVPEPGRQRRGRGQANEQPPPFA